MAVRASKVIDRRKPIDSIGQRSTAAVAKNATRSPTEISPADASSTPPSSARAKVRSGTSSSQSQMPAMAFAFLISVPRSSSACSANASCMCLPRPNAFSTRIPCTDCSTLVARSPDWSWLSRATEEYFCSKR